MQSELNSRLFQAARKGQGSTVRELLAQGADPAMRGGSLTQTPLIAAAHIGATDCVQALLPVSDPNARTPGGWTALMSAAQFGSAGCVNLLLSVSDPAVRTKDGRTLLMIAAHDGNMDCARAILSVSELLARDDEGRKASDHAQKGRNNDLAAMLLAVEQAQELRSEIAKPAAAIGVPRIKSL